MTRLFRRRRSRRQQAEGIAALLAVAAVQRAAAEDPVARWLALATAEMHSRLRCGDEITGISLNVISGGQFVLYGLRPGDAEVTVSVHDGSDPEALRRVEEALGEAFTDATVRGGPES